jgi:hypothetical protein
MTPETYSIYSGSPFASNQYDAEEQGHCQTREVLDVMKRDRFELLSAYLDGEVTADERRQVESWLDQDETVQKLYQRLLRLRQGIQTCPVPESEQSVDFMVDQVVRRANRPSRRLTLLGGGAIAAVVIGAISSLVIGSPRMQLNVVENPEMPSDGLQIALDRPVIEIPKAPMSEDAESPSLYQPNDDIR